MIYVLDGCQPERGYRGDRQNGRERNVEMIKSLLYAITDHWESPFRVTWRRRRISICKYLIRGIRGVRAATKIKAEKKIFAASIKCRNIDINVKIVNIGSFHCTGDDTKSGVLNHLERINFFSGYIIV